MCRYILYVQIHKSVVLKEKKMRKVVVLTQPKGINGRSRTRESIVDTG